MINLFFIMLMTIFVGFIMGITPYISRENIPFGIGLPLTEETIPVIKAEKRSYFILNFGLSLILGASLLILSYSEISEETVAYLSIGSLFLILIVSLVTHVIKYNQLKQYKKSLNLETAPSQKVAVDLSFREDGLIFPTSYLVGLNLIFVLITTIITVVNYASIPETIVMQWDFNMNPSRVVDKSWASVLSIPALQLFITVTMAITNNAFLSAKQQLDLNNPEVSVARDKKFRKTSSLMNYVISILTQLLFMVIQFSMIFENKISPQIVMYLSLVFTVIIIGLTLWYSFYYGQAGDRLKDNKFISNKEQLYDDNDNYWKLGMFYFNREDPAFWVEKRMGVGLTVNMAKWQAWAFFAGVIGIPILIAYFMS